MPARPPSSSWRWPDIAAHDDPHRASALLNLALIDRAALDLGHGVAGRDRAIAAAREAATIDTAPARLRLEAFRLLGGLLADEKDWAAALDAYRAATASDAGVRETKAETGLDIVAGRILGRRTHQQTGRRMIYLAARPAKQADLTSIFVGDRSELDEVRWLSRSQVNELMPGAYEPVLAYLDRDHRRHQT